MEEDRLAIGIIIPNEEILNVPVFYRESKIKEYGHEHMIKEFIEMYNLDAIDEYDLVAKGHIFLRIIDDLVIAYMPSNITELQYKKLEEQRVILERFPRFIVNFFNDNATIIENEYEDNTTEKICLDFFYNGLKEYYNLNQVRK